VTGAWPALDGSGQMAADWGDDEFLLEAALRDAWAGVYDIGRADGEWHAFRLIGGQPMTARTLGELESAIRADYTRQKSETPGTRRGAAEDAR
jgi:hypothetical protein